MCRKTLPDLSKLTCINFFFQSLTALESRKSVYPNFQEWGNWDIEMLHNLAGSDPQGLSCHSPVGAGPPAAPGGSSRIRDQPQTLQAQAPSELLDHMAQGLSILPRTLDLLKSLPLFWASFQTNSLSVTWQMGQSNRRKWGTRYPGDAEARSSLTVVCEAPGPWSPVPPCLQYIWKFFPGRVWPCLRYFHSVLPWACGERFIKLMNIPWSHILTFINRCHTYWL